MGARLKNHDFAYRFLAYLLNGLLDETGKSAAIRANCASYISSFTARAKFISPSLTKQVLEKLVAWCHQYLDEFDDGPDAEKHAVFYSANQAIFYIFCYKFKNLMNPSSDLQSRNYLESLRLHRLISSTLNPFKSEAPKSKTRNMCLQIPR